MQGNDFLTDDVVAAAETGWNCVRRRVPCIHQRGLQTVLAI